MCVLCDAWCLQVNLVFDQFIFLLSDSIYQSAVDQASSLTLDVEYRHLYESAKRTTSVTRPARRFEIQLLQRNLHLLGRSVSVCNVVSLQVNSLLRDGIEAVVRRFEGDGITCVRDLCVMCARSVGLTTSRVPLCYVW